MSVILSITEGWTGVLGPFTLKVDGSPLNLTGRTVTIHLRNALGVTVTPGGTLALLDQNTFPGMLTYTPIATDFVWSPGLFTHTQKYKIRFKVQSPAVTYHPNGSPDEVEVHRV